MSHNIGQEAAWGWEMPSKPERASRQTSKCAILQGEAARQCWELSRILHEAEPDVSKWAPAHRALVYWSKPVGDINM